MPDEPLLPPIGIIYDRLTRNERERRILRSLLRLVRSAEETAPQRPHDARPEAAGQGGGR